MYSMNVISLFQVLDQKCCLIWSRTFWENYLSWELAWACVQEGFSKLSPILKSISTTYSSASWKWFFEKLFLLCFQKKCFLRYSGSTWTSAIRERVCDITQIQCNVFLRSIIPLSFNIICKDGGGSPMLLLQLYSIPQSYLRAFVNSEWNNSHQIYL